MPKESMVWDDETNDFQPIWKVLGYDPVDALNKDIKKASEVMSKKEARFLVDNYYAKQEDRIRQVNQIKALKGTDEPHLAIQWLAENSRKMEDNLHKSLDRYSLSLPPGQWARSICGIGPVIAAGLLAHIDMEPWRCALSAESLKNKPCNPLKPHGPACMWNPTATAGQLWRYAGQDPTSIWNKGERRPWNSELKDIVWKAGQSFIKVSNNKNDVYGHLFAERKILEQQRNFSGQFIQQAREKLAKFNIGKDTATYAWYSGRLTPEQGMLITMAEAEDRDALTKKLAGPVGSGLEMLSIGHINARAQRYAAKIFLAHYHMVAYRDHFKINPPKPYLMTKEQGHAHELRCPNWPWDDYPVYQWGEQEPLSRRSTKTVQ